MRRFKDLVPIGPDFRKEFIYYTVGIIATLVTGILMIVHKYQEAFLRVQDWLNSFSNFPYSKEINLMPIEYFIGVPKYAVLVQSTMFIFWIFLLLCILMAVLHYIHHIRESKSIYLMKRLPCGRKEFFIRIFGAPLIALALETVLVLITLIIAYFIYYKSAPVGAIIPENSIFDLYHAFYIIF